MRALDISLKKSKSGVIAIMLVILIPIILLGTKYCLDNQLFQKTELEKSKGHYYKKCAKEAALAVAKNWNPGLTLEQQREGIMKVADAVYNVNPCYNDSIVGGAIPGLDMKKIIEEKNKGSIFSPLQVKYENNPAAILTIAYKDTTAYISNVSYTRYIYSQSFQGGLWNPHLALWMSIDDVTKPEFRCSYYDEIDEESAKNGKFILNQHRIFMRSSICYTGATSAVYDGVYYPNNAYHTYLSAADDYEYTKFNTSVLSPTNMGAGNYFVRNRFNGTSFKDSWFGSEEISYKERVAPDGEDPVKICIEDDKIKAQINEDVGYALPAECNVDIVLAIPVNSAANNINNLDSSNELDAVPVNNLRATKSIPQDIMKTPIYQMGQVCKRFSEEFFHIRGVTMGLIPYSAKVSLSPQRVKWTVPFAPFVSKLEDSEKMIGACLYGTRGEKGEDLTQDYKTAALITRDILPTNNTPYYWGGLLTGLPIMCRRGAFSSFSEFGSNKVCSGGLLLTSNPTSDDKRYLRMNLNPCYGVSANISTMKCETGCQTFLPNPYYMIEPTADMVKIYEMSNALYPIYDLHSISNFIFIPIEWANNFFKSWTNNPKVLGSDNELSRPSKTQAGRKKALVLLVNKPDWFEAGELTYLGFDNDGVHLSKVVEGDVNLMVNPSDVTIQIQDNIDDSTLISDKSKILEEINNILKSNPQLDNKLVRVMIKNLDEETVEKIKRDGNVSGLYIIGENSRDGLNKNESISRNKKSNNDYFYNYILYKNGYQTNKNITATQAVSNVTRAACAKLKSDYRKNLRIYVVKYRKQLTYKSEKGLGKNVKHDYSAIDSCATSSEYLYDVKNEKDLKSTLSIISKDIKTFAEYQEARNIEE